MTFPGFPKSAWLVAPVALFLASCTTAREEFATRESERATVRVVTLSPSPTRQSYEAAGTVRAGQRAVLASKVQGTVLSVAAKLGDRVRAGQTLAELESEELNAEVSRAESAYAATENLLSQAENSVTAAEAEAQLDALTARRHEDLFAKRSVSRQELDQAQARDKAAQANLQIARARIQELQARREEASAGLRAARTRKDYTRITSPFDGYIVERSVDAGTLAMPGVPLLTVEDAQGYQLEVSLPESHLGVVKMGDSVQVSIAAIGLQTDGRIVEMEPAAEAGSRSSLVRVRLPSAVGLRSGLFGRALFYLGESDLLTVPEQAVIRQGQLLSVFVVSDGQARKRLVALGRPVEDNIEVLSGLTDGEQVVVSDPHLLTDGTPVEIQP